MDDSGIEKERAQNLWASYARKIEPIAQATKLEGNPDFDLGRSRQLRRRQCPRPEQQD